eukprot:979144-Pleurochrysis_carterae.AAC.2
MPNLRGKTAFVRRIGRGDRLRARLAEATPTGSAVGLGPATLESVSKTVCKRSWRSAYTCAASTLSACVHV